MIVAFNEEALSRCFSSGFFCAVFCKPFSATVVFHVCKSQSGPSVESSYLS